MTGQCRNNVLFHDGTSHFGSVKFPHKSGKTSLTSGGMFTNNHKMGEMSIRSFPLDHFQGIKDTEEGLPEDSKPTSHKRNLRLTKSYVSFLIGFKAVVPGLIHSRQLRNYFDPRTTDFIVCNFSVAISILAKRRKDSGIRWTIAKSLGEIGFALFGWHWNNGILFSSVKGIEIALKTQYFKTVS